MNQLGTRIRELREDSSWSSRDLASACNIREKYLLDIEEGAIRFVHPRTLDKIADALGVTYDDLVKQNESVDDHDVEDEVPESYRWFVRLTLHTILVLGSLSLISILSVAVGALLIVASTFYTPASQPHSQEKTEHSSSLLSSTDSMRMLGPAQTLGLTDLADDMPLVDGRLHVLPSLD